MSAPEPTLAPGSDALGPRVLPPPGATPPATTPPATTPPAMQPAFPGLPPLPGRTTEAKRPGPKFVTAKSGKRSPSPVIQKAAAAEAKATETQAMDDAGSAPRGQNESGEERRLIQPATLAASDADASEVRLIATEPIELDDSALATYECVPAKADNLVDAVYTASAEPSARPAQAPLRPRPFVSGFVR